MAGTGAIGVSEVTRKIQSNEVDKFTLNIAYN